MANESLLKIKETLEEMLSIMGFEGKVVLDEVSQDFLRVNIETPEAGFLIGKEGESLKALRQIVHTIISRRAQEPVRYIIDVNDYQKTRLQILKETAVRLANEVVQKGFSRSLSPMNSYERRAVHMELANIPGIKTESQGEGEERKIVILPN